MCAQGFRKYLSQAKDHEELLSFLLGQIVKEKVRFYQLQRHEQPDKVSINVTELDEKVFLNALLPIAFADVFPTIGQGARHLRYAAFPPFSLVPHQWLYHGGRRDREDLPGYPGLVVTVTLLTTFHFSAVERALSLLSESICLQINVAMFTSRSCVVRIYVMYYLLPPTYMCLGKLWWNKVICANKNTA